MLPHTSYLIPNLTYMDTRAQVAGFKEEMSVLQQQIAEEQEREALWHEQLRQVFFFSLEK